MRILLGARIYVRTGRSNQDRPERWRRANDRGLAEHFRGCLETGLDVIVLCCKCASGVEGQLIRCALLPSRYRHSAFRATLDELRHGRHLQRRGVSGRPRNCGKKKAPSKSKRWSSKRNTSRWINFINQNHNFNRFLGFLSQLYTRRKSFLFWTTWHLLAPDLRRWTQLGLSVAQEDQRWDWKWPLAWQCRRAAQTETRGDFGNLEKQLLSPQILVFDFFPRNLIIWLVLVASYPRLFQALWGGMCVNITFHVHMCIQKTY